MITKNKLNKSQTTVHLKYRPRVQSILDAQQEPLSRLRNTIQSLIQLKVSQTHIRDLESVCSQIADMDMLVHENTSIKNEQHALIRRLEQLELQLHFYKQGLEHAEVIEELTQQNIKLRDAIARYRDKATKAQEEAIRSLEISQLNQALFNQISNELKHQNNQNNYYSCSVGKCGSKGAQDSNIVVECNDVQPVDNQPISNNAEVYYTMTDSFNPKQQESHELPQQQRQSVTTHDTHPDNNDNNNTNDNTNSTPTLPPQKPIINIVITNLDIVEDNTKLLTKCKQLEQELLNKESIIEDLEYQTMKLRETLNQKNNNIVELNNLIANQFRQLENNEASLLQDMQKDEQIQNQEMLINQLMNKLQIASNQSEQLVQQYESKLKELEGMKIVDADVMDNAEEKTNKLLQEMQEFCDMLDTPAEMRQSTMTYYQIIEEQKKEISELKSKLAK